MPDYAKQSLDWFAVCTAAKKRTPLCEQILDLSSGASPQNGVLFYKSVIINLLLTIF